MNPSGPSHGNFNLLRPITLRERNSPWLVTLTGMTRAVEIEKVLSDSDSSVTVTKLKDQLNQLDQLLMKENHPKLTSVPCVNTGFKVMRLKQTSKSEVVEAMRSKFISVDWLSPLSDSLIFTLVSEEQELYDKIRLAILQ